MPKYKEPRLCNVEGCNNKHCAKGLCSKHYLRYLRHGDPLVVNKSGKKKTRKICKVDGCNNEYYAKDFCKNHYNRFFKYGDTNYISKRKKVIDKINLSNFNITDKRVKYYNDYVNCNMTYQQIADKYGVSRQAVGDAIKRISQKCA